MKLARREKSLILLAGLVVLITGLYLLIIEPLIQGRERLRTLTTRLEADLTEMRTMSGHYRALVAAQDRVKGQIKARSADFSPFSYLENMAREAGLGGRIESMNPVAAPATGEDRPALTEVDLRLAGIGLIELVRFLYRLEAGRQVFFVTNLNIKPRYLTPQILDVSLRLATPKG